MNNLRIKLSRVVTDWWRSIRWAVIGFRFRINLWIRRRTPRQGLPPDYKPTELTPEEVERNPIFQDPALTPEVRLTLTPDHIRSGCSTPGEVLPPPYLGSAEELQDARPPGPKTCPTCFGWGCSSITAGVGQKCKTCHGDGRI